MDKKYPEQYYSKDFSGYIKSLNPIFKDIAFEFWVSFYGAASLAHPQIRPIFIESYGDFITESFIKFFDKEVGLTVDIKKNKFEAKLNIDDFLKVKTNLLVIEIYEQLKRKGLLDKVKEADRDMFYFLRHLRNAAAHDNVFDLKNKYGKWRTDLNCYWRDKKIDKNLQGTHLHNFFSYNLALIIMHDISYLLEN